MSASTKRNAVLALAGAAAAYLGLAWAEQVPGGWRLRNLFEPHAEREARRQAEWRAERLEAFAAEPAPAAPPVVFFGSSTIERFPLADLFPGVSVLNRGVAFEPLGLLQERLAVAVPQRIAGVVLYAGSIDHRFEDARAEDLGAGLEALVAALRSRHGEIPIAVLGLLGERDLAPAELLRLTQANDALEAAAARLGASCSFVPTLGAPLTDAAGRLAPDLSTDTLHLNEAGYRALSARLLAHGGALAQRLTPGEPK